MTKVQNNNNQILTNNVLYTLLAVVFLVGCEKSQGEKTVDTNKGYNIKKIDNCEYIEVDSGIGDYYKYTLTHKGNCKFCLARHAK